MAVQQQSTDNRYVSRRELFTASRDEVGESDQSGRQLFDACRTGDVNKVTGLIQSRWNVNMRDTAGRKSTPLHFAAGKRCLRHYLSTVLDIRGSTASQPQRKATSVNMEQQLLMHGCKIGFPSGISAF